MKNFAEVLARAAQIGPLPLVLAAAQDEEALRALKAACEAGLAQPMLVGDEALIRPLLVRVGLPSSIPIVNEPDPALAAVAAAKAVNGTQSGILMKGLVNSSDFLRAVLHPECGLRTVTSCAGQRPKALWISNVHSRRGRRLMTASAGPSARKSAQTSRLPCKGRQARGAGASAVA